MTPLVFGLIVVAGFFTGLIGFVTGLASVVSYPALLAAGLAPVSANVTNTVAMVAVGVGSTTKSFSVLVTDRRNLLKYGSCAAAGGLAGAALLLLAPAESFERTVPFLITAASLALFAQPRLRALAGTREFPRLYPLGIFLIAIYGGYFGAGAGVMFLALMLVATSDTIWRASIVKSVLTGIANAVAAVGFAFFGPVNWIAALAMAMGAFAGGWCGPPVVKVIPPTALRIVVAIAGLGLAAWLFVK
ncbi:sulfite exporter TauE/SafE family protein [Mycolicibacterium komossense]|uniref:Probable membrane transporter protein n=1 Tax=Mycolicibacterium komossense TaxID=1779 RepID=A0ABT3CHL6_9MYCO|nr:sulfite exporter TauE/SafE family protein [Mycolicibacterium komossense]MCV7228947.1 sulfite exporter TauE/SafE family protein [Mycolicibacterium komossense]